MAGFLDQLAQTINGNPQVAAYLNAMYSASKPQFDPNSAIYGSQGGLPDALSGSVDPLNQAPLPGQPNPSSQAPPPGTYPTGTNDTTIGINTGTQPSVPAGTPFDPTLGTGPAQPSTPTFAPFDTSPYDTARQAANSSAAAGTGQINDAYAAALAAINGTNAQATAQQGRVNTQLGQDTSAANARLATIIAPLLADQASTGGSGNALGTRQALLQQGLTQQAQRADALSQRFAEIQGNQNAGYLNGAHEQQQAGTDQLNRNLAAALSSIGVAQARGNATYNQGVQNATAAAAKQAQDFQNQVTLAEIRAGGNTNPTGRDLANADLTQLSNSSVPEDGQVFSAFNQVVNNPAGGPKNVADALTQFNKLAPTWKQKGASDASLNRLHDLIVNYYDTNKRSTALTGGSGSSN